MHSLISRWHTVCPPMSAPRHLLPASRLGWPNFPSIPSGVSNPFPSCLPSLVLHCRQVSRAVLPTGLSCCSTADVIKIISKGLLRYTQRQTVPGATHLVLSRVSLAHGECWRSRRLFGAGGLRFGLVSVSGRPGGRGLGGISSQ